MKSISFISKFEKEAQRYLQEKRVGDIEFSGETYQVQIFPEEGEEDFWAFFQLDEEDRPKDYFCSCTHNDDSESCIHLAAAYLAIFRSHSLPLHQRFNRSFWNFLFKSFAEGREESLPKKSAEGCYTLDTFTIEAWDTSSQRLLKQLFEERPEQTEETSLKFSNLEEHELDLWQRGHPSPELRYELSVWSDLAKALMLKQDQNENYIISFPNFETSLPKQVEIQFPHIILRCPIVVSAWPTVIPGLHTIQSPLSVHLSEEESIQEIRYDEKKKELQIKASSSGQKKPKEEKGVVEVGDWSYHPGDGFYSQEVHHLLATPSIPQESISQVLEEHTALIKKYLKDTPLHTNTVELSLSPYFDKSWNLHLTAYLNKPGDLSDELSAHFGRWIYKAGEGFYPLMKGEMSQLTTILPPQKVAAFVSKRRSWLNRIPGFKVHLTSIDTYLDYRITEDHHLFLESKLELDEENSEQTADFGPWLYIKDQGFFAKSSHHPRALLAAGQGIPPEHIASFIRKAHEDLKHVKGFFSEQCPIKSCWLDVKIEGEGSLVFTPQYTHDNGFDLETLYFFEEFVYTDGVGFYRIPPELRLPEGYWQKKVIHPEVLDNFLEQELPKLRPHLKGETSYLESPQHLESEVLQAEQRKDRSIAVQVMYHSEHGSVPATDLWSALEKGQNYFFSEAGLVDLRKTRFDYLRSLGEEKVDTTHNTLFLNTLELVRLDAFEDLSPHEEVGDENWHPLLASIFEIDPNEVPSTKGLKSQLRSYQEIGLRWLWQLYRCRLSGLLCDDMGLGKTHQSMALLAAIRTHNKASKPLFLVVCPTSVIYHWQDKLEAFLPSAKVHTYYGLKRTLEGKKYDILLTSYGVLRRDKEKLKSLNFELAIFDEIQIAKNHQSGVHTALLQLQVNMRLGLTGTPIENRIRELKALFDIVLPTYMPGESHYREFFITPIEKNLDTNRQQLLSRLIKPFILRRKKEDVLDDLPEKTEEEAYCPLLPDQQEVYSSAIQAARSGAIQNLEDRSQNISYTHIFALLTSLKQICDHPAIYLKDIQGYKNYQSGKWNLFLELLSEARASRQKVVVFSQYLGMMDIMEQYLHEQGIGYAGIRGATRDRAEQLKRFKDDPNCEVFIASLQAAGLGIDLTSASVVILYDRWWNAARERQAIDRVYRIGQKRGVQVFKMITKDSFEERIDEIIRSKGQLMEDIVGADGESFLKQLSRDELLKLLRDTHEQ